MNTSEQLDKLGGALAKFQSEMGSVKQDKINPVYRSSYADLKGIWDAIRPHLASCELSVVQDALSLPEGVSVCTRVIHSSGQWIEFGPLIMPSSRRIKQGQGGYLEVVDSHSTGSAISYAKRYAICACLGLVSDTEDDDGNKAAANIPVVKPKPKPTPPPPPPLPKFDIDEFYRLKEAKFDGLEIRAYVEECALKKGKSEQDMVNQLAHMDAKLFSESFERWKAQNK